MPAEPDVKRTVAFFDGQNLFHHARAAFGGTYPDYSPLALAARICKEHELALHEIRFYTGIPDATRAPFLEPFLVCETAGNVPRRHYDVLTTSALS